MGFAQAHRERLGAVEVHIVEEDEQAPLAQLQARINDGTVKRIPG